MVRNTQVYMTSSRSPTVHSARVPIKVDFFESSLLGWVSEVSLIRDNQLTGQGHSLIIKGIDDQ